jgi:hypothetical protein
MEAFYRCSGLTSVTIPVSVTTIGERAFVNCSSLRLDLRADIERRFGRSVLE